MSKSHVDIERDIDNLVVICQMMFDELKKIKRRRYYRKYYKNEKDNVDERINKKKKILKLIPRDAEEYVLNFD